MANLRFKKPFSDDEEGDDDAHGTLDELRLEPKFEVLWNWL